MKLKVFNEKNSHRKGVQPANLRIHKKGTCTLNVTAVRKLGLKAGDRISIVQDEDSPVDWYLLKNDEGFALRPAGTNIKALMFNNYLFAHELFRSCSLSGKSYGFRLAVVPEKKEGLELYSILTASARQ